MKKVIYLILAVMLILSCESEKKEKKNIIYADTNWIYNKTDSVYTGIKVCKTKVNGHDVVYHIFNGKNKSQMEVWHFENECAKCKKAR